jgi:uncharacterized membrane protein YphA (DoxX/SURF4 family)
MKYALWVLQVLLALLFIFAGVVKLILPGEEMISQMPFPVPVALLRFVAVCELAGDAGLILPGLFRIHPELTPLAAAGLVFIMIGATVITVLGGMVLGALFPFVVGVLCAYVAYARWTVAPLHGRRA